MLLVFALLAALQAAPALAQAVSVTPSYPQATAAAREWYRQGQPIELAGDLYYPTGPTIAFRPDSMVPTGSYDGITLFADTTIEPYSEVLVPIGHRLFRPYERRRAGDLAGTSGSHAPSFPVEVRPWQHPEGDRPEAGGDQGPWPGRRSGGRQPRTEPTCETLLQPPGHIETARPPEGNRGIWIKYSGRRWESAGEAVEFRTRQFRRVGDYYGFPVYERAAGPEQGVARNEIFIPSRDDMLAPYRQTQ
jgi:hypothetical protein